MAINTVWFHDKLNTKGKSLRDLARFLGLDPSAVSRMLKGERKMTAEEQDQIAAFLDVGILDVAAHRRGDPQGFQGLGFEESLQQAYVPQGGQTSRVSLVDPADPAFVHPAFGCMVGTMTVPDDLDLTAPMDAEWSDTLYNA
ncbi:helix-turn-helix protein [Rhizobium sp. PP-F2F-G38]|nr:helix-turn-helix protein [Rhizobium sp. PP-WC-1G-195]PYF00890.1 helix-turn-helix protein [Rhizobium sp. PP-F2F-G38]